MTAYLFTGAWAASVVALCYVNHRIAKRRQRHEQIEALAQAVIDSLAVVTLYDAPITSAEAQAMQRALGFQAAMDVLSKRTGWRPGKAVSA